MDERKPTPSAPAPADVRARQSRAERCYVPPPPPPMQTVTKGWWVLREGTTTAEELAKARIDRG